VLYGQKLADPALMRIRLIIVRATLRVPRTAPRLSPVAVRPMPQIRGHNLEGRMGKRHRRPQPAGWDKAVRPLLKPEHIERISDTQVRITLPPVPDFDIEEDEIIRLRIPASVLVNATQDIDAGTLTIKADSFEERIDNSLKGLQEERAAIAGCSQLGTFLLTFFTCEIVAKALVSHVRYGRTGRKALGDKWSAKDISLALRELGIRYDGNSLDVLFSTEQALASEMSARVLRDNIAHRMKDLRRRAVRARYSDLMAEMDRFLGAAAAWREQSRLTTQAGGPSSGRA
jgi:hypothetical protein